MGRLAQTLGVMKSTTAMLDDFFAAVPLHLHKRSGKVFYTGRMAFSRRSTLYVLGLNPGGDPETNSDETIGAHSQQVIHSLPEMWSAYRDESWEGAKPGTWQMQPRVLHMFRSLGVNPASVPCSNLVFARTKDEASLNAELPILMPACWPFHRAVLAYHRPRVILCFGQTAGDLVRLQLNAHELIGQFIENNSRRWKSSAYRAPDGIKVVVATHPSRVKWQEPATDPSSLIASALHDA